MSSPSSGQAAASATSDSPRDSQYKAWQQAPLSCSRCRQKKVKCNKTYPCAACQHAGAECFYPRRQERLEARRRKAKSHHAELMDRLSRLEGLVNKAESNPNRPGTAVHFSEEVKPFRPGINIPRMDEQFKNQITMLSITPDDSQSESSDGLIDRYISSDFWSNLSDQITGMKEFLNNPSYTDEDEDQEIPEPRSPFSVYSSPGDFVFGVDTSHSPLSHPSIPQIASLCDYYMTMIQPVLLVLHRPSLRSFVQKAISSLPEIPGGKGMEAILFAMYFAAVSSMAKSECAALFDAPKDAILAEYKHNVERALTRADFMNKPEVASLQALTIYLFTIRAHDQGPTSWTLTPLVIRVAYGLGLHREAPGRHRSPFETEMRRRLWWELCILDVRASEDRGSPPVICEGSFNTKKPANINDEDFGPQSESIVSSDGWKTTTFHLVVYELYRVIKQINYAFPSIEGGEELSSQRKQQLATEVYKHVEEEYMVHCNTAIPFQWFASKCIYMWFSRIQLGIHYPVHPVKRIALSKPCFKTDDILRTAMTAVENAYLLETNAGAPWFWCSKSWSSWHPLAILLAELCIHTSGELSDRAWAIANVVFEPWGKRVADRNQGMLWRPIKKLYEKALEARTNGNGQTSNNQGLGFAPILNFSSYPLTTLPAVLDGDPFVDMSTLNGEWDTSVILQRTDCAQSETRMSFDAMAEVDPNALSWAWPWTDPKLLNPNDHGFGYNGN